jgi:TRAP-type C4-dicarboxylate transport system permease large subunit
MFSSTLAWLLTIQEAPQSLAAFMTENSQSRTTVVLAIGPCSPSFGTTLYISASIGKVSVIGTTKALWPSYLLAGLVVVVVAFFPQWVGAI